MFPVIWLGWAELGKSADGLLVSFLYKISYDFSIFDFDIQVKKVAGIIVLIMFIIIKLDSRVNWIEEIAEPVKFFIRTIENEENIIYKSFPAEY